LDPDIKMLIERQRIIDVGLRYGAAIDRRDHQALRQCFMPDGVWSTPLGDQVGGDSIGNSLLAMCACLDATQHITTNQIVTITGDRAAMRSDFIASHLRYDHPEGPNYMIGGVYDDALQRSEDGWKFTRRALSVLWVMGNPKVIIGGQGIPIRR
jgi:ketosteroid isomerase-like protein